MAAVRLRLLPLCLLALLGASPALPPTPVVPLPEAPAVEPPATSEPEEEGLAPPQAVPSRTESPPLSRARPLPPKDDLLAQARGDGRGGLAVKGRPLTLDAGLQEALVRLMRDYQTPWAAAVVVEPSTGRVLALAEYSHAQPELRGLSTRAVFPAASVFKIVTGSALLKTGVSAEDEACFHGGKRRLTEKLLQDSARDGSCYSLATAMGKSANVVFAKFTQKHLSAEALRREAAALRFNRPIPFAQPTDVSLASIPEEPFALAQAGAGFGDVYLSPLHGALLAGAVANGGLWRDPVLFADEAGSEPERVMTEAQADALTHMMEQTVTQGTARHAFHERGFRVEGAVGKTGTLADRNPFRDYSWFVGFAPKDRPRVAVGVVVVNEARWRIRATWLAREAMRLALERRPVQTAGGAPVTAGGGR